MLSACGLVCSTCEYHPEPCPGCREVAGRPFWVNETVENRCVLFNCCEEKQFKTCGECSELPCKLFIELKDPSLSEEEHRREVDRRVARLREKA